MKLSRKNKLHLIAFAVQIHDKKGDHLAKAMHEKRCRFCFKHLDPDDPDVRSILDETFQNVLQNVFPFKIDFSEHLPRHTCKQCSWNVLDFNSFSEIVQRNQKIFGSKHLPHETLADHCYMKQEMEKENADPMIHQKEILSSPCEEYVLHSCGLDNTALATCKAELDDIVVTNEMHPDLMSYSFDTLEEYNANITCESYKITPFFYNDSTELSKSLNDCNNVNDTSFENIDRTLCESAINNNTNDSSEVPPENTSAGFSCNECDRKFHSRKQMIDHYQSHRNTSCKICCKTLRIKSMKRHLRTHILDNHCAVCGKSYMRREYLENHIKTKHPSSSKVRKAKKSINTKA